MKLQTISLGIFVALIATMPFIASTGLSISTGEQIVEVPIPVAVAIPQGDSYVEETVFAIEYKVPRLDEVDGIKLLGDGEEFTTNITAAVNMTFLRHERAYTYYNISIQVNHTVRFWAWAWIDNFENGRSELEGLDPVLHGEKGHWIFILDQYDSLPTDYYPRFLSAEGAQGNVTHDGVNMPLYIPYDSNITVYYGVRDENVSRNIPTLACSLSRDSLDNGTLTESQDLDTVHFVNMTYHRLREEDDTAMYKLSILFYEDNVTLGNEVIEGPIRYFFFTANNSAGWEHSGENTVVHQFSNGFDLDSETVEDLFFETEDVVLRVNAINATANDTFGLYYRVLESVSNDTALVNWTILNETSPSFVFHNHSVCNATGDEYAEWEIPPKYTLDEYNVTLGKFETDRLIQYKATSWYMGKQYNQSTHRGLTIGNSTPYLSFSSPTNGSYLDESVVHVNYLASVEKGNFTTVTIDFGDGSSNTVNYTANEEDTGYTNHTYTQDGEYLVLLTGITDYNVSSTINCTIFVDTTDPVVEILSREPTLATLTNSRRISLTFTASDEMSDELESLIIFWGDGLGEDVAGLETATHVFGGNGEYEIILRATDKAGNTGDDQFTITIRIPTDETSSDVPFSWLTFVSLLLIVPVLRKKTLHSSD